MIMDSSLVKKGGYIEEMPVSALNARASTENKVNLNMRNSNIGVLDGNIEPLNV